MDFSHYSVVLEVPAAANTAGTDGTAYVTWGLPVPGVVESARFVSDRAVTAHDTNNCDISLEIDGTEIASEVTSTGDTGDLAAGTDIALALTASGASLEVGEYSVFALKATKGGTGVAIGGTATVRVRLDRLGS